MRTRKILFALSPFLLAGCHADVDVSGRNDGGDGDNVHVAMKDDGKGSAVSVNVPGFKANVSLPDLNLGGHVDLDGIKLAPDTKIAGIDVNAGDEGGSEDKGRVKLDFSNPHPPAALLDHYAKSAAEAGYGAIARTASSLTASKGDKNFALQVQPDGSGSQGTITVSGTG